MLLDRFREAKAEEIALLMDMASRRELPRPWKGRRPDFLKALSLIHISEPTRPY